MRWDRGEGGGYAQHVTSAPYEGTSAKPVLLHVALGDGYFDDVRLVELIRVEEGSKVKQGEVLARLESTDFLEQIENSKAQMQQAAAQVSSAKASIRRAEADLAEAKRQLGVNERLFGEKGACAGCWCMFWRLEKGERFDDVQHAGSIEREALRPAERCRQHFNLAVGINSSQ